MILVSGLQSFSLVVAAFNEDHYQGLDGIIVLYYIMHYICNTDFCQIWPFRLFVIPAMESWDVQLRWNKAASPNRINGMFNVRLELDERCNNSKRL